MFTLKAAKGCSIVPRIHKFYLTNSNRAQQHSRPETSSFHDLLQGRSAASNGNLTTGTHASYNKPDATIQSQLSSRKLSSRKLSSRKALNQKLVDSSQLESYDWHSCFLQQTRRNNPVATIQSQAIQSQAIQSQGAKPKAGRLLTTGTRRNPRSVSTNPDDVALLPRLVPQFHSWSPSRNTIPPATGSSILRLDSTQVLPSYAGTNNKRKVQNNEECSPKSLNPQDKRTAQISPKASNSSNPTITDSALIQGQKWVAIDRAKLGEFNATKIIKNRGWKRQESAMESYGEQ
ncbi:hypothetical protein F511_03781 [Dorcoceras hygrometricum]|uniref:Uncharacterized protein n=1 Tax=Dorcoceras hygrometricum TaxID=472368 RepID=A0A2Z7B5D7_9LAMI|nr:hypothetical protein F511_03781 [Dorcoceras hygrometricum]